MRWYIADNFDEGNHFVKQLNQLRQLEPQKFPNGVTIRPIPRAKKQINSLVNITLANDPRWNVYPRPAEGLQSPEAQALFDKTASRMSQWFSDLWYFLDMKDRVREVVTYGFKYRVGYAEIGADAEGNIFIDAYEPYDIWHEPGIKSLKETSVLIKAVSRTLDYLKNAKSGEMEDVIDPGTDEAMLDPMTGEPMQREKPLYKPECVAKLKPETRFSIADWKDIRLKQETKGNAEAISDPRIARAFILEVWIKDNDHWDLVTFCQDQILREEHTDYTELPFAAYSPHEGLLYSSSQYHDLIPLNQAVDIQVAMQEAYARVTAIARMLKPKLTKMSRQINEQGEVVEYEGAVKPEYLPPPPASGANAQALQTYLNLMDEVGTSVISFGKVPKGVKAAQALENLKDIEYANNQTPIDRLSSFLEEVGEKVIDLADRNFKSPVTIYHMTDGKPDFFQLVSQSSIAAENPQNNAVPVSGKYMVKVEIETGFEHSERGKRETAKELYSLGVLPVEDLLKAYKYSNVDEILSKLNAQASIIQTPEFKLLPQPLQQAIIAFFQQPRPTIPTEEPPVEEQPPLEAAA